MRRRGAWGFAAPAKEGRLGLGPRKFKIIILIIHMIKHNQKDRRLLTYFNIKAYLVILVKKSST